MKHTKLVIGLVAVLAGGVTLAQARDVVGPLGSISLGDKSKATASPAAGPKSPLPTAGALKSVAQATHDPVAPAIGAKSNFQTMPAATARPAVVKAPVPAAKPQQQAQAPVRAVPPAPKPNVIAKPAHTVAVAPVAAKAKDVVPTTAIATAAALSAPAKPSAAALHASPMPTAVASPVVIPRVPAPRRVEPLPLSEREVAYQNHEEQLIREIRLLELEAKAADLRRKIAGESANGPDSVNIPPPVLPTASVLDLPEEPPVRLISIWGEPSALTADVLANGIRTSVKPGDKLPDGWRVVEVGRNSMLIQRGKKKTLLKMGA